MLVLSLWGKNQFHVFKTSSSVHHCYSFFIPCKSYLLVVVLNPKFDTVYYSPGSSLEPILMAYSSHENTNAPKTSSQVLLIMHGMMGSKSNWNTLSKVLHNKTSSKVRDQKTSVVVLN